MLLMRAGELVTREELQQELWGREVSVEFDAGLNRCIRQIRAALSDEADTPRYIETVPRKGYRFIAALNRAPDMASESSPNENAVVLATSLPSELSNAPSILPVPITTASAVQTRFLFGIQIALAVLLLAALIIFLGVRQKAILPQVKYSFDYVPLANNPGSQVNPSFSPDGREVTYTWNDKSTGSFHIFRKLVDSPNSQQLTSGNQIDSNPVWSPDGRSIAFCRGGSERTAAVWVLPASGGSERKLVDLESGPWPFERTLSWSADSKWLVVSERLAHSSHHGLSVINIDTASSRQLSNPGAGEDDNSPSISPDGKTLVFTRDVGHGISFLHTVPFDPYQAKLRSVRTLVWKGFENVASTDASWTPDGQTLIFSSNKGGKQHLYAAASDGRGEPVDLAALGDDLSLPAVSRRGQLSYVHRAFNVEIRKVTLWPAEKAGTSERIVASTRVSFTPAVSPSGSHIAFSSDQYGVTEIWTSKADGSDLKQLTFLRNPGTGSPAWSPDGSQIVFDSRSDSRPKLYIVPSQGGLPRRLTGAEDGLVPVWSPDGRWIFYTSDSSGREEIWRISPSGGMAEQVTTEGGFAPAISPDGKLLYFTDSRSAPFRLWRLNLQTKHKDLVAPAIIKRAYAAAKDGVYFVVGSPFGHQELRFLSMKAARAKLISGLDPPVEASMSLTPDAHGLYLAQTERSSHELLIAENFWRK